MGYYEKIVAFLYYDSISNSWQQVTPEQLAVVNDSSAYIIPIDEDGNQGEQITWGEYESPEQQKAREKAILHAALKEEQRRKAEEEEQAKIQAEKEKEEQERLKKEQEEKTKEEAHLREEEEKQKKEYDCRQRQATNLQSIFDKLGSANIELTCLLVRKLCRLVIVVFWLNFFAGGALIGLTASPEEKAQGLACGLLASVFVSLIILGVVSSWAENDEKKEK